MAKTHKSQVMLTMLTDKLKKWLAASMPVVTESFDSDGNPVTTFSADATPAAGEKVAVLRICPTEADYAQDIFGNPALRFSPHRIQLCTETGASATAEVALTPADLVPIMIECGRTGTIFEHYKSANTVLPAVAQMTAANLKAKWQDLYFNIQLSQ